MNFTMNIAMKFDQVAAFGEKWKQHYPIISAPAVTLQRNVTLPLTIISTLGR